ncbi:hypothetical protein MTO96_010645 [Rhipicephalus appendiculatus]
MSTAAGHEHSPWVRFDEDDNDARRWRCARITGAAEACKCASGASKRPDRAAGDTSDGPVAALRHQRGHPFPEFGHFLYKRSTATFTLVTGIARARGPRTTFARRPDHSRSHTLDTSGTADVHACAKGRRACPISHKETSLLPSSSDYRRRLTLCAPSFCPGSGASLVLSPPVLHGAARELLLVRRKCSYRDQTQRWPEKKRTLVTEHRRPFLVDSPGRRPTGPPVLIFLKKSQVGLAHTRFSFFLLRAVSEP